MTEQLTTSDKLRGRLEELHERHKSDLPGFAWASEFDRWAELVFCLLNQVSQQQPTVVRSAIHMLQDMNLLGVEQLATVRGSPDEVGIVIAYVLELHGFSKDEAQRSVGVLRSLAKVVQSTFHGSIQKYLRKAAARMQVELVEAFASEHLDAAEVRYAVTHWLQNALSLPISLNHPGVMRFLEENRASHEELQQAADALDLNLAVVDDLVELEYLKSRGVEQG